MEFKRLTGNDLWGELFHEKLSFGHVLFITYMIYMNHDETIQANNKIHMFVKTWVSAVDVTLEAQSDKSDMRRSSCSPSFSKGILYCNTSSTLEIFTAELPWYKTIKRNHILVFWSRLQVTLIVVKLRFLMRIMFYNKIVYS